MIVQSAAPGEPHLVITMAEHMALAGAFAEAFGNDDFEAVEPRAEMVFVVGNHDQGWADFDAAGEFDPNTGLPCSLLDTPLEKIVGTSSASPDFNERHHPYCGLMSSMHSWGLYNGRYGMSDKVLVEVVDPGLRPVVDAMLDGELARQDRLKRTLAADPLSAPWIEDDRLFQNYKQLQFFDTLALYFNRDHEGSRQTSEFTHVPGNSRRDVTVTVTPLGDATYGLAPYPFAESGIAFAFSGRYLAPRGDLDGQVLDGVPLDDVPRASQSITLTDG